MRLLSTLAVFGVLFVSSANADILYDNGAVTGSVGAWDITDSAVTNSFTLSGQSTVTSLNFGTWSTEPGTTPIAPTQVSWEITSTPLSSTVIASGTASITASYVGSDQLGFGQDIFLDSINLPNINLAAGSYWIELLSATNGTGNPVYWDQSVSGASQAYITNPTSSIPSEAFQINGTVSAVPLPAAVWLFGAALMGWLGICKHRRQSAQ